ncbi:hypothetical protein AAY473_024668 [Plecturocebus cupreus]
MKLEIIILSKLTQEQKIKHHMFSLIASPLYRQAGCVTRSRLTATSVFGFSNSPASASRVAGLGTHHSRLFFRWSFAMLARLVSNFSAQAIHPPRLPKVLGLKFSFGGRPFPTELDLPRFSCACSQSSALPIAILLVGMGPVEPD